MREQSTGAGSASRSGLARCTPSREAARGLASEFALIPVYREVLADMLTPVRAYTLLCPPGEPGFLLESVEGGERLARYSFIGFQPRRSTSAMAIRSTRLLRWPARRRRRLKAFRDFTAARSGTWGTRRHVTSSGCRSRRARRHRCRKARFCVPRT